MTSINVNVEGMAALTAQLAKISDAGENVVSDTIAELALTTEANAVTGIRGGAATGRVYKRGGVSHRASAPGEYPASDTGRLMLSVASEIAPFEARVGTNVPYGQYLEFGTTRMPEPRPWLLPSFEAAKVGVEQDLKRRIEAKT